MFKRVSSVAVALSAAMLVMYALAQDGQDDGIRSYPVPGYQVFPECVAYHPESNMIFSASSNDGTIYRGELQTGELEESALRVLVPAESAAISQAFGIDVDPQGRLWVAGGPTGNAAVYDADTGEVLATLTAPAAAQHFLNDVAVAPNGTAYFTDSYNPVMYRSTTSDGEIGSLEPWLRFEGSPIAYQPGDSQLARVNLNGLAVTPDGRYLITVQMNTGELYRISLDESQTVMPIDVGGETFVNGDGLALEDSTLYVVRIANEEIVTIDLADDYTSGEVVNRFTHEQLIFPACAATAQDRLLVANTQFNRQGGDSPNPLIPFTVVSFPSEMVRTGQQQGTQQETEAAEQEDAEEGQQEQADDQQQAAVQTAAWFPQEQVQAGQQAYAASCAACHGNDLEGVGGVGPDIHGEEFMNSFGGQPVSSLFSYIRNNMPLGNPGSLSAETYLDITAHILAENDFPVGDAPPLQPGSDRLNELSVTQENRVED